MHRKPTIAEERKANRFLKVAQPVVRAIYDELYWDVANNCYNPDKEWGSASEFMEFVAHQILKIMDKPKLGTSEYPETRNIRKPKAKKIKQ